MTKHNLNEIIEFGERLIKTEDLDPIYVALHKAELPLNQMYRLLIAYWCFYHLGVSAYLSEFDNEGFWAAMETAATNKQFPATFDTKLPLGAWPRGAERRHFRGQKCVEAIMHLHGDPNEPYPAEHFAWALHSATFSTGATLETVMGWVQQKPMFGPWIAFKVADMLERILAARIVFPNDLLLIYKEPRAALDMLRLPPEEACGQLLTHFREFLAPPRYDRPCNIQEVETILCKWKSCINGHYWVGKDIHEVRHGLKGWGKTADRLTSRMPREVEREGLFV